MMNSKYFLAVIYAMVQLLNEVIAIVETHTPLSRSQRATLRKREMELNRAIENIPEKK